MSIYCLKSDRINPDLPIFSPLYIPRLKRNHTVQHRQHFRMGWKRTEQDKACHIPRHNRVQMFHIKNWYLLKYFQSCVRAPRSMLKISTCKILHLAGSQISSQNDRQLYNRFTDEPNQSPSSEHLWTLGLVLSATIFGQMILTLRWVHDYIQKVHCMISLPHEEK